MGGETERRVEGGLVLRKFFCVGVGAVCWFFGFCFWFGCFFGFCLTRVYWGFTRCLLGVCLVFSGCFVGCLWFLGGWSEL